MQRFFKKLAANPFSYLGHLFYKYTIAPWKYGQGDDYRADRYWEDRFRQKGATLTAVGDEGLSLEENRKMYEEAGKVFWELLNEENITLQDKTILEIGTGNGFFTQILYENGARRYTGLDITDALFEHLRHRFPGFHFQKQDITAEPITGKYDLILFIDVIEHIVQEAKMLSALHHIQEALNPGGVLLFAPFMKKGRKEHFHLRLWTYEELAPHLKPLKIGPLKPFRYGHIAAVRKEEIYEA